MFDDGRCAQHYASMNRAASLRLLCVLTAFGLIGITACSNSPTEAQSGQQADAQATTAGLSMDRAGAGRPPMSMNDAAWQVVKAGSTDTFQALVATGTTYSGRVVLRITIPGSEYDGSTTCYRYNFTHSMNDYEPTRLSSCPTGPPARLTTPVPEPVVDTPAHLTKLTALLNGLTSAQFANPASVQT